MNELKIINTVIKLVQGNIVTQPVEAIVNAANSQLAGGGGVDGAIHRAAGTRELLELTRGFGGCPTGSAVITAAAKIPPPVKYIIHAVGPVYRNGQNGEPALLAGAYTRSLELADENKISSVAFPAISAGVYGYPMQAAAKIALSTVSNYVRSRGTDLKEIRFVLFDAVALQIYQKELQNLSETEAS